jgi:hypothetical protein
MDITSKYNELFYKTCLLIASIDDFEKTMMKNIVYRKEIVYHPRFREILILRDMLTNFAKE